MSLQEALTRARAITLLDEELSARVGLADLRRRQGQRESAREILAEVWEPARLGPFPLVLADAYVVLAQLEQEEGHKQAAIEAATAAYRAAWCDGPPFAYAWGLSQAGRLLKILGAPVPVLPPFDASRFAPMPEVSIEPSAEELAAMRANQREEAAPRSDAPSPQPGGIVRRVWDWLRGG